MITDRLDLDQKITGDFDANIAQPLNIRVSYPNAPFERPDDEPWIHFSIVYGDKLPAEFGGPTRRYRTPGVLFCNIYLPLGLGTARIASIAGRIASRYRDASRDGVYFETSTIGESRREAGMWKMTVQCPFYGESLE